MDWPTIIHGFWNFITGGPLSFTLSPSDHRTGICPEVLTSITPTIGTGDLGTSVSQAGNVYSITGGTRPENGTNLFHSFGEFSVGTIDTAQFLNTTPELTTSNILGRITGETSPTSSAPFIRKDSGA